MSDYWILDDEHRPVKAELMEWARWFEKGDRIVKQEVIGDARISTVFLGIDHQYGDGPPLIFETMVFGGEHDRYQDRCSTWKEAEAMHEKACSLVRKNLSS